MPVPAGLIVQVTLVLLALATVAVNCCVWEAKSVAELGFNVTETGGFTVIVTLALLVVSAVLVAVIVTGVGAVTCAAVYRPPAVMEPVPAGLIIHVTLALVEFVIVAENCCVCAATKVADVGETLIESGIRFAIALALLVVSAALVAVMVTLVAAGIWNRGLSRDVSCSNLRACKASHRQNQLRFSAEFSCLSSQPE